MCFICGQPDFVRCNCVPAQPLCDQCDFNTVCGEIVDSACVHYHFANPNQPTRLINMGMPNNSSAEAIFERIDSLIGTNFNLPIIPVDTNTIDLTVSGLANHTIKGDVRISEQSGNTLQVQNDGLFVPIFNPDYLVKVGADAPPRYLKNAIVGGTDGCVSITASEDPTSKLLLLQPIIDVECLAGKICDSSGGTSILAPCLIEAGLSVLDTSTIDLTLTPGFPAVLSGLVKISSIGGNLIVRESDGIYASGGTASADNGLNITSGPVELGGTLIKTTTIDQAAFQLSFTNSKFSIGSSTALDPTVEFGLFSSDPAITSMSLLQNTQNISDVSYAANNVYLKVTGGPFVQASTNHFLFGSGGSLWVSNTGGNITLDGGTPNPYSGLYGVVVKSANHNITGNIISGGYFCGFPADSGSVSGMAGIRIGGAENPPPIFGAAFSGTITNYYGMYIEDIAASAHGGAVTNKFAIYQLGGSDISRFFGPVQNASSTTQFTSDSRVKENIIPLSRGLAEIEQINTYKFNYTYNKAKTVTGVIAQELEQIIPEAVEQGNFSTPDGSQTFEDFRMVDQTVLFHTMLNAIKELSARNKALEARVTALEPKV